MILTSQNKQKQFSISHIAKNNMCCQKEERNVYSRKRKPFSIFRTLLKTHFSEEMEGGKMDVKEKSSVCIKGGRVLFYVEGLVLISNISNGMKCGASIRILQ